jgi:hypothetical protein
LKKPNREKKPIKIFKKTYQFGFGFISLKPKKPNRTQTEKNREKNRAKPENPSQTGFCPKKLNRTETGRFEPVSVFFKKYSVWLLFFFYKNQTKNNHPYLKLM